jgi:hypothetical protein
MAIRPYPSEWLADVELDGGITEIVLSGRTTRRSIATFRQRHARRSTLEVLHRRPDLSHRFPARLTDRLCARDGVRRDRQNRRPPRGCAWPPIPTTQQVPILVRSDSRARARLAAAAAPDRMPRPGSSTCTGLCWRNTTMLQMCREIGFPSNANLTTATGARRPVAELNHTAACVASSAAVPR